MLAGLPLSSGPRRQRERGGRSWQRGQAVGAVRWTAQLTRATTAARALPTRSRWIRTIRLRCVRIRGRHQKIRHVRTRRKRFVRGRPLDDMSGNKVEGKKLGLNALRPVVKGSMDASQGVFCQTTGLPHPSTSTPHDAPVPKPKCRPHMQVTAMTGIRIRELSSGEEN